MMIKYFLPFIASTLLATEIVVDLPTQKTLQPIYIAEIQVKDNPLQSPYYKQLDEILRFDFDHNGRTRVAEKNPKYDAILSDDAYQKAFYPKIWNDIDVGYVIKTHVIGKALHATVYLSSSTTVKHFKAVDLTGRLNEDRQAIHRLSDSIFFELFKTRGIASTKILYTQQPSLQSLESEIYECDYDGANQKPVTSEKAKSITPYTIDATRFLYACYKSGQTRIYIGKKGFNQGQPYIPLSGSQFHPAMSPRKDMIAFTSDNQGRNDLFIQPLDRNLKPVGKPTHLYAYPQSVTASPTFSPDGSQIAFVSDKTGNPQIYIIETQTAAGKRPDAKLLTSRHNSCVCPTWSPDGRYIAYSAKVDGIRQIWVFDLQKQTTSQLTHGPGNKENPSWAANSQHLVYNTSDGNNYDLFIAHIHHNQPRRISNSPGLQHYPTWAN